MWRIEHRLSDKVLMRYYLLLVVLSCWLAAAFDVWYVALAPGLLWVGVLGVFRFRWIYLMLGAAIPLSIEVELPGGLGTDFPSEQLMWALTGMAVLLFARYWRRIPSDYILHPITLLLAAHLVWLSLCMLTSQWWLVSFKYWLAKGWYVITFFAVPLLVFGAVSSFRAMVNWTAVTLVLTLLYVLARHAALGFSFEQVNYVVGPFYRNHVIYACLPAVFFPYLWYRWAGFKSWSLAWLGWGFAMVVSLLAINFAYTRAAYVSLLACLLLYVIIRWRLLKHALSVAALVVAMFIGFVGTGDNWLRFAPDYERAISHTQFESLLDATTRLEDISVMERVYRWVAGVYMVQERPWQGFGPGTFYFFYKNYTVNSFKTYVSDNPERSGMHNYYLMTAVEQGLPGLFLFLLFSVAVLLRGERVYHAAREPESKRLVMAAILSFSSILLLMLMNDLVETDKIGSFFFLSAALILRADINNRRALKRDRNA